MGRSSGNPTIRVLFLGAPGVGKNCLESQFTTTTYPPPYNPALTLNSRRFFTLTPRPPTPLTSITRPLNTSHGLSSLEVTASSMTKVESKDGGSSLYSNPASARTDPTAVKNIAQSELGATSQRREQPDVCLDCLRANSTFMIEIINYPHLQRARERSQVYAKGEYDAVLLVYDVANRRSFEAISALHSEIPKSHGQGHSANKGSNGGGSSPSNVHNRRSGRSGKSGKSGQSEPVIALVGNKSDFDTDYASIELGLEGPLHDKVAELQEADSNERHLVHPLFRESRFYDELPLSPSSRNMLDGNRQSCASAGDATQNPRTSVLTQRSLRSVRSVRTLPEGRRERAKLRKAPSKTDVVEKWIETGNPVVVEEGQQLGSNNPQNSEGQRNDGDRPLESPVPEAIEEEEDLTQDTDSTSAAKRQVSRLEGDALTQRLGLTVPFLETSAKTGENVEEAFEAIIRAVLKEKGIEVDDGRVTSARPCKRKHAKRVDIKVETQFLPTIESLLTPEATPASAIDSIFSMMGDDNASSPLSPVDKTRLLEEAAMAAASSSASTATKTEVGTLTPLTNEEKAADVVVELKIEPVTTEQPKREDVRINGEAKSSVGETTRELPAGLASKDEEAEDEARDVILAEIPRPPPKSVTKGAAALDNLIADPRPRRGGVMRRVKSLLLLRRPESLAGTSARA